MSKQNLRRASRELFRRTNDEVFADLPSLRDHCNKAKAASQELWVPPKELEIGFQSSIALNARDASFAFNDWSFSQLCSLAGVGKETVNRLSPATAAQVFRETMPNGSKPIQLFTEENRLRAIQGVNYTRLFNADVLSMLSDFATDFQPPQRAAFGAGGDDESGGTGLYCGEQDMFVFLIDPLGWIEIEGEHFAPGMFVWNSEVGRRSLGIQTFWFQAVCQNHIVWDAIDVVEFSRKHTANVHESLREVRDLIVRTVEKRDARKDAFASLLKQAMSEKAGADREDAEHFLADIGIGQRLARAALDMAALKGRFTIFAVVDALTQLSQSHPNAAERLEADRKAARALQLLADSMPAHNVVL